MTGLEWLSFWVGWVWSVPAGTVLYKFLLRRVAPSRELPRWAAAIEEDGALQLACIGALALGVVLDPPVDLLVWAAYYGLLAHLRLVFWFNHSCEALGEDRAWRIRWLSAGTLFFAPFTMPMLWAAGELTPSGYPPDSEVGRRIEELRAREERWIAARFMPEPVEPRPPVVDPTTLPAIPEAVEGWRLFQLQADAIRGLFLVGMHGQRWSGIEFTAVCYDRVDGPVIATQESCVHHLANPSWHHAPGCGIYSTKRPTFIPPGYFIARCLSYGVVAEHEHGYRAQHCRIEELFLIAPEHVTRPFAVPGIEERYGIPVNVVYPDLVDQVFAQWRSPDGDR
ncbi:MAG: hypothetical protein AB7U23_10030 [Dehalococcoidia bacterium]